MRRTELALDGEARSVPEARRFVERTLVAWDLGELAWSACLVVSELATNAALHARTPFIVAVALEDDLVRIEVRDGSERLPRRRSHGLQSTTGRGLRLVDELSSRWGVEPTTRGPGKAVWALLAAAPGVGEHDGEGEADLDALLAAFSDDLDDLGDRGDLDDRGGSDGADGPGVRGSGRAPAQQRG